MRRRLGLLAIAGIFPAFIAFAQPGKPAAKPGYVSYVRAWHAPAPDKTPPVDTSGRAMLALYALNTSESIEIAASGDQGGFLSHDLDRAAHVLREPGSGNEHPIEPKLLDVVYRIQAHFHAQQIRVISAYRTPHGSPSNHGKGRAIDIVVPGASDEDVAKFAREMGFLGVGIYPTSGFVHVDVRDRSYFWTDSSGPGRKNRERGILGDVARRSDTAAASRGEHGLGSLVIGGDVDAVRRAHAPAPATSAPPPPEEDED